MTAFDVDIHRVRLTYGSDSQHFGELHLPYVPETAHSHQSHPLVILIHGGFWHTPYDYTLMTGLADDLARRGIAAWNIEYRRVGDPGGGWPNTLLDVANATDAVGSFAPTYHLNVRRVVAVGHSAGGHLALWLAARPRIPQSDILANTATPLALSGVISQAGVSDLEMGWQRNLGSGAVAALLNASPDKKPARYAVASPAAMLPLGVPQVLVHGTADDRVPYEMSQSYLARAQTAGDNIQLITLPDVDHFALIDPSSQAWKLTVDALKHLHTL